MPIHRQHIQGKHCSDSHALHISMSLINFKENNNMIMVIWEKLQMSEKTGSSFAYEL